ncbi:MAG: UDP-glucose--hexose-1-phosphate uridylyltransferase [Fulvivirga sp.]
MNEFSLSEHSHRRLNILTGEWVQVSPHRTKRPWQGKNEAVANAQRPTYDPGCYLCPGNERANGEKNPDYEGVLVFNNDFAALSNNIPTGSYNEDDLLIAKSESGICRVMCFSPRHDLTLAEMAVDDIAKVTAAWKKEYLELGSRPEINYVQIFENKGAIMGCSNPHPHGQIWASQTIPDEPAKEQVMQLKHFKEKGKTLLEAYLAKELQLKERIVLENEHFIVLVPFWAVWPFETIIISREPFSDIGKMDSSRLRSLAEAIKGLTKVYDRVFDTSFPYSAGIHQAPTDVEEHPEWHFHMHFYPPLLRSATVKKFMVGFEMLGNPQRDITAEYSAGMLRDLASRL